MHRAKTRRRKEKMRIVRDRRAEVGPSFAEASVFAKGGLRRDKTEGRRRMPATRNTTNSINSRDGDYSNNSEWDPKRAGLSSKSEIV